MNLKGRCISIQPDHLILKTEHHSAQRVELKSTPANIHLGDIVEVRNGTTRVLTPNRTQGNLKWMERILSPRRLRAMEIREKVEGGIREFFRSQQFREVRTPLLVPSPGMEPHIRPFQAGSAGAPDVRRHYYLPTSPEFAMKRLLVGGLERIFQICPAFRDEPFSVTHFPEFTMLEWYRAYAGYEEIMADTEQLFERLAMQIHGKPEITYQGRRISVKAPWPRLKVRDLFLEKVGVDLVQAAKVEDLAKECQRLGLPVNLATETWDDLYFKIWLNHIEPNLPQDQAVFVLRYPPSQAALSVIDSDPDGTRWARRFEAYAGGLELGNAFEELTDPTEQRHRFEEDMELRTQLYGPDFPKSPLDESFLGALSEGMPPAGGIAMGVDRIVMLFADESDIEYCFWLKNEEASQ